LLFENYGQEVEGPIQYILLKVGGGGQSPPGPYGCCAYGRCRNYSAIVAAYDTRRI